MIADDRFDVVDIYSVTTTILLPWSVYVSFMSASLFSSCARDDSFPAAESASPSGRGEA